MNSYNIVTSTVYSNQYVNSYNIVTITVLYEENYTKYLRPVTALPKGQ